jgi:hypothetical protein
MSNNDGAARRSSAWFAAEGRNGFIHRSRMRNQGFGPEVFDGRPVICIANSWSELTPCNARLRDVAEAVKRGVAVATAGGATGDGMGGGTGNARVGARRGWAKLYTDHVLQADRGADLDFLTGGSGSQVPRHSH